jgi:hypothetical protein
MNTHIYQELEQLTVAQRRSLGEALISSADSEASAPLISEKQRSELRNRLSYHRAHPDEPGISFAELKVKLQSKRSRHIKNCHRALLHAEKGIGTSPNQT